jgi:hypothetical protein
MMSLGIYVGQEVKITKVWTPKRAGREREGLEGEPRAKRKIRSCWKYHVSLGGSIWDYKEPVAEGFPTMYSVLAIFQRNTKQELFSHFQLFV